MKNFQLKVSQSHILLPSPFYLTTFFRARSIQDIIKLNAILYYRYDEKEMQVINTMISAAYRLQYSHYFKNAQHDIERYKKK